MDDAVARAMRRWPDVPGIAGYLSLDQRGNWRLQDRIIDHPRTIAFINRNYHAEADGRWFFQNGPQRAYVRLAYTPWVYRWSTQGLQTHTGLPVTGPRSAWVDELGHLLIESEHGIGVVDDRHLAALAEHIDSHEGSGNDASATLHVHDVHLPLNPVNSADVAGLFGFNPDP